MELPGITGWKVLYVVFSNISCSCQSNHPLERMNTNARTQVQDAERGEIVAEVSASSAETPPLEELKWVRSLLYDL